MPDDTPRESREGAFFMKAEPVWIAGREREMNLQVGFRAVVDGGRPGSTILHVTACSAYRATVNGHIVGYGPARAAHGWFRVDRWDLAPHLRPGPNVVAVEVSGYNVDCFSTPNGPAFLQAEVTADGRVLAATGDEHDGFEAIVKPSRRQKVALYSYQRAFCEAYRMGPHSDAWRNMLSWPEGLPSALHRSPAPLAVGPARRLLPRGVAYPDFSLVGPKSLISRGDVTAADLPPDPQEPDAVTARSGDGFPRSEFEDNALLDMQGIEFTTRPPAEEPVSPAWLAGEQFRTYDFGLDLTGFIRLDVACEEPTHLILTFDEILVDSDIDCTRPGAINLVSYRLEPGRYALETFEPYTMRYLKIIALGGACELREVGLRLYVCDGVGRARFGCADRRLERIFEAGRETFRQNAVDIFMDCPSRERAGWLCDSFFTARVEPMLTGASRIERNFIENFLLPESFANLPEGMLPMCYPSDSRGEYPFIPNWAMWFVLQLEEYLARSGDRGMVLGLRPRVLGLLDYLTGYCNDEGLLEKLPGWIFVEWSAANDFVQDVNYPTNMLYAGMLDAASRLYDLPEAAAQAAELRETIRRRSFDGELFIDNATRQPDGTLAETQNHTEACQYYAFYFSVATPQTHSDLWRTLVRDFGPGRGRADVPAANSLVGNMLRTEALSRAGLSQQIADEAVGYLAYMAERTGTLWENVDDRASCNHGFASHICFTLFRDLLGVRDVDHVGKHIRLRAPDASMSWCSGEIPIGDGALCVRWDRGSDGIPAYTVDAPPGYRVTVEAP